MLIRAGQVAGFSQLALRQFVERVLAHWNRCYPESTRGRESTELAALASAGIETAARYSITRERDVCEFLDVILFFGANFDNDPRYMLFRHALRSPYLSDPSERVTFLKEAAREYRERA